MGETLSKTKLKQKGWRHGSRGHKILSLNPSTAHIPPKQKKETGKMMIRYKGRCNNDFFSV
jgi:hypothetical protein